MTPFLSKGDIETEVPTGELGGDCGVQHHYIRSHILGFNTDTEADCPFG